LMNRQSTNATKFTTREDALDSRVPQITCKV
jgi:hypothetical protein